MIVRTLTHRPDSATAEALADFEEQFEYPLGPYDTFSISHGSEYLPFFMAMGAATLLVVEHHDLVVGTMVLIRRQLQICDSGMTGEQAKPHATEAHYICDLKISPAARSTSALAHLLKAAVGMIRPFESHACYSVVMAGTNSQPASYTGRMGIPGFDAVGEITIARVVAAENCDFGQVVDVSPDRHSSKLNELLQPGIQAVSVDPSMRSIIPIQQFCHKDATAIGLLEDTRRGKRLIHGSGNELLSSHLSGLRWSTPEAAADVIRSAFNRSLELGFPAMFCAVPGSRWKQLEPALNGLTYHLTSATIYGFAVPRYMDWWIDTSEI